MSSRGRLHFTFTTPALEPAPSPPFYDVPPRETSSPGQALLLPLRYLRLGGMLG